MFESRDLVSYKGSPQFFLLNRVDVAGGDSVVDFFYRRRRITYRPMITTNTSAADVTRNCSTP